jgi:hypothetical protein
MSEDNWIGIIIPTKDGKYMMAKAIIEEDKTIESLKDAAIIVADSEGKKEDLKYPFVLLQDIEILKQKLIDDLYQLELDKDTHDREYDWVSNIVDIINKRFNIDV